MNRWSISGGTEASFGTHLLQLALFTFLYSFKIFVLQNHLAGLYRMNI